MLSISKYISIILITMLIIISSLSGLGKSGGGIIFTSTTTTRPQITENFLAQSTWGTPNQVAAPGENLVPLTITLINEGPYDIQNVSFYPLNNTLIKFLRYQVINISELSVGQSYSYTYLVNVNSSDKLGTYKLPLKVFFNVTNYGRYNETIYYPLVIDGYLNFSASIAFSSPVYAGEKDVVATLTIVNTGNVEATNVTVLLNSEYPVTFITHKILIPAIEAGGSYEAEVLLNIDNNASLGTYIIPISVEVYNKSYITLTSLSLTGTISLIASGQVQGTTFPGGRNDQLLFTLFNTGNVLLTNVTIYPVSNYPFQFLLNSIEIPLIPPDSEYTVTIPFNVYPNASIGVYKAEFIVNYAGKNSTLTIPIEVNSNITIEGHIISANWISSIPHPNTQDAQVQLVIAYQGPIDSIGFSGVIYLPKGFTNISGGDEVYVNGPALSPGAYTTITFALNVGSISPGSYTFPLTIYWYSNNNGVEETYVQNLTFTLVISGENLFTVYSNGPSELSPNTYVNISYIIFNQGDENAYNITLTLVPETPGVQVLTSTFYIPEIHAHQNYSIVAELYIPSTVQGETVALQLSIVYTTPLGLQSQYAQQFYYYVPVLNQPNLPISISLVNSSITMGKVQNSLLVIKDVGDIPLYNVSIILTSQELYLNLTALTIGTLEPGQTITLPVSIFTQLSGLVVINAQVTYYTQLGQERQEELNINLLSSGSVSLIITGESTIPTIGVPGQLISVTATVYNFGTGEAEGVTAIVSTPSGIKIVGEPTYYIGNIGSFSSATFTFAFLISNSTSPGTYTIPVKFVYTNDIGQVLTSYGNITITVSQSSSNVTTFTHRFDSGGRRLGFIIPLATIVVVIIVVVVLVSLIRRKSGGK